MKYYLDTEFIEGFRGATLIPYRPTPQHFINLISIGIIREDGHSYYAISKEYNYDDADEWVKANVISPLYSTTVRHYERGLYTPKNFHKYKGQSLDEIREGLLAFFQCYQKDDRNVAPENIEIYGYYADYDWVLFCSLFGRMIDLPKNFPMYCRDLKQMLDEKVEAKRIVHQETSGARLLTFNEKLEEIKKRSDYPKQDDEHNALSDAKWNQKLHQFILNI